jgi:uncharacterized protein
MDEYGRGELHYAALRNDTGAIARLLADGELVDGQDVEGFAPLHFAAQEYSVDAVEALLAAGAETDITNRFGNTPLWVATMRSRGRGAVIRLLRAHGADPFRTNHQGKSSVDVARSIGNYDVAQFYSDL